MTSAFPETVNANNDWPILIPIEAIAERWGCGIRWLKDHACRQGLGKRAGKKILFDRAEYDALYRSLPCPSSSSGVKAAPSGTHAEPSEAKASSRVRALRTELSRKPTGRSGKRNYMK